MPLDPGSLRHWITIQRRTRARDAFGNQDEPKYRELASCWAFVRPVGAGRERLLAMQVQAEGSFVITVRFDPVLADLSSTDRVIFGKRIFDISGPPINVNEADEEMQIPATEHQRER